MSEKFQLLYEEFTELFMKPLLCGGTTQAVRFLSPHLLTHFTLARPADDLLEGEILETMVALASRLVHVGALPSEDRGMMATAMALHDLFAVTDPQLDRAFARGARKDALTWVAKLIAEIPLPTTRGHALARHVILERGLACFREDTVVKNWAYTYRFFGRPPPANVVALPKLRFVRQTTNRTSMIEQMNNQGTDTHAAIVQRLTRELVARSPVTQLLRPELTPDLQFGLASLAAMSDRALRSGIVQALVERGTGPVAQPFGHALRVLSALAPPPEYLGAALTFLVELQLLEVLDERAGHRPTDEPAVGDEEFFAAILPALFQTKGPMKQLLQMETFDLKNIRARADERAQQAGDDAVEFALSVLERALPLTPTPSPLGFGGMVGSPP